MTGDPDPRNLISEAYRVPDIDEAECRTIFLDWVLGLPDGADVAALVRLLLARREAIPGHPMTHILQSATGEGGSPRRRRGTRRHDGRGRVSGAGRRPSTRGR